MKKFRLLKILMLLLLFAGMGTQAYAKRPHLLLISLDGFRWDYTSRGITPNLDSLMNEGVAALSLKPVFPSSTFPNHLSIITGMYPENHGIIANKFKNPYSNEEFSLSDKETVRDPKWYTGEAFWTTAKRYGIKTASYFWPGSELNDPQRRPDIFHEYDHDRPYMTRINGVLDWIAMPYNLRPQFMTLYFHETDSRGHAYGPDSENINEGIRMIDSLLGILFTGIRNAGIADSLDIMVVSDHGMTKVSLQRSVNIDKILTGLDYEIQNYGSFAMISPDGNKDRIISTLKINEQHFKVYAREDVPDYLHYSDNPLISPVVLIAEPGWMIMSGEKSYAGDLNGAHGYVNWWTDMHGIFIASGPNFKRNYRTGTLENIDIYPLLCEIFGILPRGNIDGDLNRIKFILEDE